MKIFDQTAGQFVSVWKIYSTTLPTLYHSYAFSKHQFEFEMAETSNLEGFLVSKLKILRVASARCVPDLTHSVNS